MKKVMIKKHVTSKKPAGTPGGNFGWGNMRHDSRTRCHIRNKKYAPPPPPLIQTPIRLFSTEKSFKKNPPNSIYHFQKAQNIILFQENFRAKPVKCITSCSSKTALRIGHLFSNKNGGDFGAISVTERSRRADL